MHRIFSAPAPKVIREAIKRKATTHFALFDSPAELADYANVAGNWRSLGGEPEWFGYDTKETASTKARCGDLSLVEASDRLLEKFEQFAFATDSRAWVNDVCGSVPDVPAFIAGHPLAMRRRIKTESNHAPIAIIADLTTSAGLSADTIARRGAAILALVRVLSARRPIELWAGSTIDADDRKNACAVYARIDTAPLDLATAAYVLTSASFPRMLCYGIATAKFGFQGAWGFNRSDLQKQHAGAILAPAFSHVSRAVVIPPAHYTDGIADNPEAWIEARLAEITATSLADAA